ncbi:MAG: hypothetical protein R3324_08850 [Halobacteriales archaeon]|nr:hypothetical protein [Halobacteriales archaeon]
MSNATNPFETMLELQRRSLEQTREAIRRSADLGNQANAMAAESLESGRSVQQRGNELIRSLTEAYTSALEQMVPGETGPMGDLQRIFEDQLDAVEEVNEQSWQALEEMMEENSRAFEALTEEYLEMVDESTEEALATLERFQGEMASSESSSE